MRLWSIFVIILLCIITPAIALSNNADILQNATFKQKIIQSLDQSSFLTNVYLSVRTALSATRQNQEAYFDLGQSKTILEQQTISKKHVITAFPQRQLCIGEYTAHPQTDGRHYSQTINIKTMFPHLLSGGIKTADPERKIIAMASKIATQGGN